MKIYTETPNRIKPIIIEKEGVTTFGLKKVLKQDKTLSHYYFPIVFGPYVTDEPWIEKFNEITNFIRKNVKETKEGNGISFEKFNPLKEEPGEDPIMFLKVGHHKGKVFSRFYGQDKRNRLNPDFMIDEYFDVNVRIKIESVYINSTNAYLQVSLVDVIVRPISRFESEDEKIPESESDDE